MIVFNQKMQFDNLIKNGFEKYPNFRDLTILAKEWFFIDKLDEKSIKSQLFSFCVEKVTTFNEENIRKLIQKVMKKLKVTDKYTEIPEKLTFFKEEVEQISKIINKEWQKIIFIFCCLSKLRKSDGIYLNSQNSMKLSDIFDLCGIKKTKKEQEFYLYELNKANLLTVDLKPLLKYHPVCLRKEGEIALEITPSCDMISELLKINGTPIIKCLRCGKEVFKTNNRVKYCPECARIIHIEKTMESKKKKNSCI